MTLRRSMVALYYGAPRLQHAATPLQPPLLHTLEIKQKLELDLSVQPQSHHTHIHTKIRATSARKVQLSDGPLEPSI